MEFYSSSGSIINPEWLKYYFNTRELKRCISDIKLRYVGDMTMESPLSINDDNDLVYDYYYEQLDIQMDKVRGFYEEMKELYFEEYQMYLNKIKGIDLDEAMAKRGCCEERVINPKKELLAIFRKVQNLAHFAVLNENALLQLLELFEAELIIQHSPVDTKFITEDLVSKMNEIEFSFTKLFYDGDIAIANKKIRPRQHSYFELFTSGFSAGVCIIILFLAIAAVILPPELDDTDHFWIIFPLFRALGVPLIFLWTWSLLLVLWKRSKINHIVIFELAKTAEESESVLTYLNMLKIASTYTFVWCLFFFLYVIQAKRYIDLVHVRYEYYPLVCFITYLVLTFLPLNLFYRDSRYYFLDTLFNAVFAPCTRLAFRDFFLADILTSLTKPMVDLAALICFFWHFEVDDIWHANVYTSCSTLRRIFFNTLILYLPFHIRFFQCLKKYFITGKAHPHLVNAGKYFTGIMNVFFGSVISVLYYNKDKNTYMTWLVLSVGFQFAATTYSYIWDLTMDWSLIDIKHKFLRKEKILEYDWPYYAIMIGDFIGRYFWLAATIGSWYSGVPADLRYTFEAVLEVLRRSMWAYFRVENECIHNREDYRKLDFVPMLPGRKPHVNRSLTSIDESILDL